MFMNTILNVIKHRLQHKDKQYLIISMIDLNTTSEKIKLWKTTYKQYEFFKQNNSYLACDLISEAEISELLPEAEISELIPINK